MAMWRPTSNLTVISLSANVAWMLLGLGALAAAQWGFLIILARVGGPELVGGFTLALAIATPVMLFGRLQMRQLQAADAGGQYSFREYLVVRLATAPGCLLVILGIGLAAGYDAATVVALVSVGMMKAVEGLNDIFYGLEQRHQRHDLMGKSLVLRGVLGVAALSTALLITENLAMVAAAVAAAWMLVWILLDRPVTLRWRSLRASQTNKGSRQFLMKRRFRLAWKGVPLGIAVLLFSLSTNVPRYFVEGVLGSEALGIFGALAYFVAVGQTVIGAVCEAAVPELANRWATRDWAGFQNLLGRLFVTAMLIGLAGVAVAALFGEGILRFVYGQQFADNSDLFLLIMIVGFVTYSITPIGYTLIVLRSINLQPGILAVAVIVNVGGCFVLVPIYGMRGAVDGWLLGVLSQGLLGLCILGQQLHRARVARAAVGGS